MSALRASSDGRFDYWGGDDSYLWAERLEDEPEDEDEYVDPEIAAIADRVYGESSERVA